MKHIEGDLRYMLSFDSPESALVWCAAVQECAMYIEWPESALKQWPEEREGSELLFRGPRYGARGGGAGRLPAAVQGAQVRGGKAEDRAGSRLFFKGPRFWGHREGALIVALGLEKVILRPSLLQAQDGRVRGLSQLHHA